MIKKIVLIVLTLLIASSSYADQITVQMKDATVIEVVTKIAREGNVAIIISQGFNGELKIPLIDFQNVTTEQMLSTVAQLTISRVDSQTYFIGKLSPDAKNTLQDVHPYIPSNAKILQPFQYDYPLGSHVQLKNVSIGNVLLIIATSCNVAISNSEAVDQSEIIQQINIQQMTPEVAFKELSKATGLMVTKTNANTYLVSKDATDRDKMLNHFWPSIPSNPRERLRSYFIEPLRYQ
jgi:hypothetical protein